MPSPLRIAQMPPPQLIILALCPRPRHGTCSGLDQLSYFMTIYQASLNNNLMATLAAGQVTPSNSKQYRIDQVGGMKGNSQGGAAFTFVWNQGEMRGPITAASRAPLPFSLSTLSPLEFHLHSPLPVLLRSAPPSSPSTALPSTPPTACSAPPMRADRWSWPRCGCASAPSSCRWPAAR